VDGGCRRGGTRAATIVHDPDADRRPTRRWAQGQTVSRITNL
jgi:hypothetical protein